MMVNMVFRGKKKPVISSFKLIDSMVASELWRSRGDAKRSVKEGSAYLNEGKITDAGRMITDSDLIHGKYYLLRRGKKRFFFFEVLQEDDPRIKELQLGD